MNSKKLLSQTTKFLKLAQQTIYNVSPQVVRIQNRLKKENYNFGAVDGKLGPATIKALQQWYVDHGFEVPSQLTSFVTDYNQELAEYRKMYALYRELTDIVRMEKTGVAMLQIADKVKNLPRGNAIITALNQNLWGDDLLKLIYQALLGKEAQAEYYSIFNEVILQALKDMDNTPVNPYRQ